MGINVLIADDEVPNRRTMGMVFHNTCGDVQIDQAGNGKELLDAVSTNPDKYGLIVTDCNMPYMSGPEAVFKIFTETRSRALVAFMSAENLDDDDRALLSLLLSDNRALGILPKPFELTDLRAVIDAACESDKQREAARRTLIGATKVAAKFLHINLPDRFKS